MKRNNISAHLVSVTLGGTSAKLMTFGPRDHISNILCGTGSFYEADLLLKMRELHIPGTTILDIGANIGNHAVFAAKAFGAQVFCFEPYAPAFKLLRENVLLNGISDQVKILNVGLGETAGRGTVVPGPVSNRGQSRFRKSAAGKIAMMTIDTLLSTGVVGIIKIDVEGSELDVLRGGIETLAEYHPHVFVEAAGEEAFLRIADLLLSLGFIPVGRFCWTPTYLFSAVDQATRMRAIISRSALQTSGLVRGTKPQ